MGFDSDNMYLVRAHRCGKFKQNNSRPIIVCFRDFPDVELVMSSVYRLKGTRYSIDRDFPTRDSPST